MLSVHAQIKYKKSIWGVVKGFIEKNTWAGLEEYFNSMQQALQSETCIPPAKAKGRRPRRGKHYKLTIPTANVTVHDKIDQYSYNTTAVSTIDATTLFVTTIATDTTITATTSIASISTAKLTFTTKSPYSIVNTITVTNSYNRQSNSPHQQHNHLH